MEPTAENDPLKAYFRSARDAGDAAAACPSPDLFFRWSGGWVTEDEREALVRHAAGCPACADKIAVLEGAKARGYADDALPAETDKHLRRAMRERLRSVRRPSDAGRRLWFAAFLVFMALSFAWPQYFLQMLVLAVVCAAKWLIDTRARHIYVSVLHRREGEGGPAAGGRLKEGQKALFRRPAD